MTHSLVRFTGCITYLKDISQGFIALTIANRVTLGEKTHGCYLPAQAKGGFADKVRNRNLKKGDVVEIEGRLSKHNHQTQVFITKLNVLPREGLAFHQDSKGQDVLVNGVNEVTLQGRLGKDGHGGVYSNGETGNFSVALNESFVDRRGEEQQATVWVPVSAYDGLATEAQKLRKGQLVEVRGVVQMRGSRGRGQEMTTKALEITVH